MNQSKRSACSILEQGIESALGISLAFGICLVRGRYRHALAETSAFNSVSNAPSVMRPPQTSKALDAELDP